MDFAKLQATGNDFILIDARELEKDWSSLATTICDRHFGVGADGLLLVLKSEVADFGMRMFNPDGSEAEACGNGLRCFTKYVIDHGLADSQELVVETIGGIRRVRSHTIGGEVKQVEVDMGIPRLRPEEIPISIQVDITPIMDYPIQIEDRELRLTFVSMGNPHAVCFIEKEVAGFPLSKLGPLIECHPIFPQRTNFEVAKVLSPKQVIARVWERGAGETLSCGSGACAIAVAAQLHGWVGNQVEVALPGGVLTVKWDGRGEVRLTGPAEVVFEGEWITEVV